MKCSCCGGELPNGESVCPLCGENMVVSKPKAIDKRKRILAAALAFITCAGIVAGALAMQPGTASTVKETEKSSSVLTYSTKNEVHTLLPGSNQELSIIKNAAKDLNAHSTFSAIIQDSSSYAQQNYVQVGDELIFVRTSLNGIDSAAQTYDVDYDLCAVKPDGEIVLIDTDVQGISCVSDRSVYYLKGSSEAAYQYRYNKDGITAISDLFAADFVRITHCSDDDSILGFVAADIDEENNIIMKSGIMHDDHGYSFHEEDADNEVYFISPNGEHIYVMEIADEIGRVVNLKYVSDQENLSLTTIAENVSDFVFYEDSGNMTCIANATLDDDVMNLVGQVLYFDAETKESHILADNAVALVESAEKSYYWLNENSREMFVTEQTNVTSIPVQAANGTHFIDASGNFCAADRNGNIFTISEGFYDPENYAYAADLMFPTEKDGIFYWAQGDQVYKYVIGSMTAPEVVTLDADLSSKLESGMEIGYLLTEDGSVLEQSGSTLNVKPFGGASFTIYDSENTVFVIGLSTDGEKIYFVDQNCTLMEKTLSDDSPVTVLAENIYDVSVVSNGIYILTDYTEDGGILQYRGFDDSTFTILRNGVMSMVETLS